MKKMWPALVALLILGIFVGAALIKQPTSPVIPEPTSIPSLQPTIENRQLTSSPVTPTTNLTVQPTTDNRIPITIPVSEIPLTISSPLPDAIITISSATIRGKTTPGADVSINEKDVIADANGNYNATIALDQGENLVIVTAVDPDGLVAEKEIVVTYDPGE
jgi:hypothetical protein